MGAFKRSRRNISTFRDNCSTLDSLHNELIDEDYRTYMNSLSRSEDEDESDEEDDTDPQYKIFLENLKEDGHSYILATTKGGKPVFLKYEEVSESDNFRSRLDEEITEAGILKYQEVSGSVEELETQARMNLGSHLDEEKTEAGGDVGDISNGSKSASSHNDEPLSQPEEDHVMEEDDSMLDISYQEFLKDRKQEGDVFYIIGEDGKKVIYEEEVESPDKVIYEEEVESPDSEILATATATDTASDSDEGNDNPPLTSKDIDSQMERPKLECLGCPNENSSSQFRKDLMSILERPFNQTEYEQLRKDIEVQKPMTGYRNLRGGPKAYTEDKCGKSYLEHHNDLKEKIDKTRLDRRKTLNLLRGFFYWLQNLSQEGSFCPWLDNLCLEVLPKKR